MVVVPPTPEGIETAAQAIRARQVAAYPTETVYGLGADPFSPEALDRLFQIKGRPSDNPVLVIVDSEEQLPRIAGPLSGKVHALARAFWPGPLSLVLPKTPDVPDALTAGGATVCVRCPGCATARALCRAAGGIITSTSANVSGAPAARTAKEAGLPGVAVVVDGGELPVREPSTVFEPESGRILREGAVTAGQLRAYHTG